MKILFTLLSTLLLATAALAKPAPRAAAPTPGLTLEFVENKGQWAAPARFAGALPGGRVFAQTDGLRFALFSHVDLPGHGPRLAAGAPTPSTCTLGLR